MPADTRCPTQSHHFRCEFDEGHAGPCECVAPEYATARLPCVIQAVPVAAEVPAKTEEQSK